MGELHHFLQYTSLMAITEFYWWWEQEFVENTTDLLQVTDRLNHIMSYRVHLVINWMCTRSLNCDSQWLHRINTYQIIKNYNAITVTEDSGRLCCTVRKSDDMFKKLIGTRTNRKSEKEQCLSYLQTFNIIDIFFFSPFLAKLFALLFIYT